MRERREGRREGRGGLRTRPKTTKMPVMAQTVAERMTGNWALSAVDSSMGRIIPIPSKQYTETPASNEQGQQGSCEAPGGQVGGEQGKLPD